MDRKLEYLTGEIAEYFSLSNMGIHYLEKKGIIHSSRKDNGYRVYHADELTKLGEIRAFERMGFSLQEANSFHYDYSNILEKIKNKEKELKNQLELIHYYESLFCSKVIKIEEKLTKENTCIESLDVVYWCPCWEEQYNLDFISKETLEEMKKIDCSWLSAMPYMRYCSKVEFDDTSLKAIRGNSIDEQYAKKENVVITSLVEKYSFPKALTFVCEMDTYETILNKVKAYMDISKLEHIALFRILETAVPENTSYTVVKVIIPYK